MVRTLGRCTGMAAIVLGTFSLLPATGQEPAPAETAPPDAAAAPEAEPQAQQPPAAVPQPPVAAPPQAEDAPRPPAPPPSAQQPPLPQPPAEAPSPMPPAVNPPPYPQPSAQPPAASGTTVACGPLARTLQDALGPQFPGVQVILAQSQPDGSVALYGVLPSPDLQPNVEQAALNVLQNQQVPGIAGPVGSVNASYMRPSMAAAVEQILPAGADGVMVIQSFDPANHRMTVAGWVAAPAAIDRLRQLGECWTLDVSQVLLARVPTRPVQAATFAYAMAMDALGRYNGPALVYAANHVIRYGVGMPELVTRAWYLRAAGHILMNDIPTAKADLRVAVAMDVPDPGLSVRFDALERFQGHPRFLLEAYISEFGEPVVDLGQLLAPPPGPVPQDILPPQSDVEL